jgi:hypothetical protein
MSSHDRTLSPGTDRNNSSKDATVASKRFPADEALQTTGQRGPEVVLAADYDLLRGVLREAHRALDAIATTSLPIHDRVREFAREAAIGNKPPAHETPEQLTDAEKLLQAWADPLPPNGRLYWAHVEKAREYFKQRTAKAGEQP